MNDRIISARPVNATAARVTSRGIHWDSQRKAGDCPEWDAPPPVYDTKKIAALLRIPGTSFVDLTGKQFGRFSVVGFLGSPNPKKGGRWLVRCTCGQYEQRTVKAITNPGNANDMCHACRYLEHLKGRR